MKIAVAGSEFFQRYIREIREARLFESVEIIELFIANENIDCPKVAQDLEKINAQITVIGPRHYQILKAYLNVPCYIIRPGIVDFLSLNKQIEDHTTTCTLLPYPEDIDFSALEGLESKVVVLIDIDQIQEKYFEKLLYTGISRAKVHLYIFCTSQIKKVLDERYLQGVKKWNKFIAAN